MNLAGLNTEPSDFSNGVEWLGRGLGLCWWICRLFARNLRFSIHLLISGVIPWDILFAEQLHGPCSRT